MRCAIYTRVSTDKQSTDMQTVELRKHALCATWNIVAELTDTTSGASRTRDGLTKLLELAESGAIDLVLVWKLDRLARSLRHLLELSDRLEQCGVQLVSLRDAGIDTTTATGRCFFQIMGAVAELERGIIRERVRSGVALARIKRGGKWGPVNRREEKRAEVERLHEEGLAYREIAKRVGCSNGTIGRLLIAKRNR